MDTNKNINFSNMNNKALLVNTNETSKAHYINSNPLINNKPQYMPTSLQQQPMQIMSPTNQCFNNPFLKSLSIPAYNVTLKNIIFQECDASLWKGMLQHHGSQKQVLVKMMLMGKEGSKVDNITSNIASFSSAPPHDHLCQTIATCVNNVPSKNMADTKYKTNNTTNNFNNFNNYDASNPSDSSSCNSNHVVNMLNNRRFDSNIINFINNNNNINDNSDTFASDYDNVYNTLSFTNNKTKRFDDYDNYANIDLLLNKEQNSTKLSKNRSVCLKNKDSQVTHCVLLMYPLADEVNLKHFLLHKYDNQEPLTTEQLMCMCVQLASALQHLHHHQLLHQDLAVRNCLIDGCLTLKLCDNAFSPQLFPEEYEEPSVLSRHIMSQRSNEGPQPVRWMAVEQLQGAPNSKQTDMWSLGVTIWEMLTMGQLPYTSLPSSELLKFLKTSFRLPQPPICPDNLFNLLKCCWAEDPSSRPQIELFKSSLHNMCMALVRGQ